MIGANNDYEGVRMKNITIRQLIDELNKLDKDAIIGVRDADTEWFMEITSIYKCKYKGKDAYVIGDSKYCGECNYPDDEEIAIDFEKENKQ